MTFNQDPKAQLPASVNADIKNHFTEEDLFRIILCKMTERFKAVDQEIPETDETKVVAKVKEDPEKKMPFVAPLDTSERENEKKIYQKYVREKVKCASLGKKLPYAV